MTRRPASLALLLLPLAACSSAGADAGKSAVRDSAGIEIVESTAPAWKEGEGWTVAARPSLDIGGDDAGPEGQLFGVRAAFRTGDGRVVVANSGTHQLRLYDGAGKHLASIGGQGEGPGEFKGMHWAGTGRADSILVWDGLSRRLSVFAPDGRFARSVSPASLKWMLPQVYGVLGDGSVVATAGTDFSQADSRREGERRDSVTYLRFAPDGGDLGALGRFPGPELFVSRTERGVLHDQVIFGRTFLVLPTADGFVTGDNDRFELRRHAPDGRVTRIVRRAHSAAAVTPEDLERFWAEQEERESGSGASGEMAAALAEMRREYRARATHRNTFPAYQGIKLDPEGNLWAREYRRPGSEGPERWSVFDPEGRWLGTVETPEGLAVLQVGRDFVLGLARDEDDVEHVRVHRLERRIPGGGGS